MPMTMPQFVAALQCKPAIGAIWYQPMSVAMEMAAITTPLRQAHLLAQVGHESLSLRVVREMVPKTITDQSGRDAYFESKYGWKSGHKNAFRMGHTVPGRGAKYFGRGPIQCTWYRNYLDFGTWHVPADPTVYVRTPELLETPTVGSAFCAWYWITRKINQLADLDDVAGVTKKINGGTTGLDDRVARLRVAKSILLLPNPNGKLEV